MAGVGKSLVKEQNNLIKKQAKEYGKRSIVRLYTFGYLYAHKNVHSFLGECWIEECMANDADISSPNVEHAWVSLDIACQNNKDFYTCIHIHKSIKILWVWGLYSQYNYQYCELSNGLRKRFRVDFTTFPLLEMAKLTSCLQSFYTIHEMQDWCHAMVSFSSAAVLKPATQAGSSFPLANASKWYQEKTGLSPIFCSLLMLKVRCLRLQWMSIFLLLFVVFKRAANLSFYSCNAFIFGVASAFRLIARCVWEKVCRFYLFIKVYVISLSLSQISLVCKILRSVNLFFVKLCSLFTQHHHNVYIYK